MTEIPTRSKTLHPLNRDTATPHRRLDADEVARALGADPVPVKHKPSGGPIVVNAIREKMLTPTDPVPGNVVLLSDLQIERMATMVREKTVLLSSASPAQILQAYLEIALVPRVTS